MKPLYVSLKPFLDHTAMTRPVVWEAIFGNSNPLEVEIGSGNGEFLARYGDEHPNRNVVGFEEYCERVSRTLRKLSRCQHFNTRVMRLDVRVGLKYFFIPNSIHHVFCLFPPPWPKKGDIKHRLFTPNFLRLVNNRLVPNGVLKIVTDYAPYSAWIQEQLEGTGFKLILNEIGANYGTKFEAKWVGTGQQKFYELLLHKSEHVDMPIVEEVVVQHFVIDHFNPDQFTMNNYSGPDMAIVYKDYLYDPNKATAQVQLLVSDEHLLQNVRVLIFKDDNIWRVKLASGSMQMPTPGIAKAIELVRDAAVGVGH